MESNLEIQVNRLMNRKFTNILQILISLFATLFLIGYSIRSLSWNIAEILYLSLIILFAIGINIYEKYSINVLFFLISITSVVPSSLKVMNLTLSNLLLYFTLLTSIIVFLNNFQNKIRINKKLTSSIILFAGLGTISAIANIGRHESLFDMFLSGTVRPISYLVLMLSLDKGIGESSQNIIKLFNYIIYITVASSLLTLGMFVFGIDNSLNLGVETIRNYSAASRYVNYRISGASTSNGMGTHLSLVIPITIFLILQMKNHRKRICYFIFLLIEFIALMLTYSRMAIAVTFLGIFLYIILIGKNKIKTLIWFSGGSIALFLLTPGLIQRFLFDSNNRLALLYLGVKTALNNLIFGIGPGNYATTVASRKIKVVISTPYGPAIDTPHNSFVLTAAETGLFSSLLFIAIIIGIIIYFLKNFIRKDNNSNGYNLLTPIFISTFIFILQNLTGNLFYAPIVATYFWVFTAVGYIIVNLEKDKNS